MQDFPFKPAESAEPATWLTERLQTFAVNVLSIVPHGFEAYARVFHPAWQATHTGRTPLRWSEVAARTGRTPHRQMQWQSIRGDEPEIYDYTLLKEDDTWLEGPEMGNLPADLARALWQVLGEHTTTPEKCFFGIWEGCGCLARSVSEAPAFEIPARRFHLFEAPVEAIEKTFCTDDVNEARGMGLVVFADPAENLSPAEIEEALRNLPAPNIFVSHQSANLWWPADRAWCVATEIDFVTTYIAGSRAAVDAVLECETLEVCEVESTDEVS